MNPLYAKAYALRIKGKSYNEIQAELGVSKSTLSSWFKDLVLSEKAQERLRKRTYVATLHGLVKRNKMQTVLAEKRARLANAQAKRMIGRITKRELLLIGVSLYWAEGYKRLIVRDGKERMSHVIRFVNADPAMIRIFIRFLSEMIEVKQEDIFLSMRLYPHINEGAARKYWQSASGLPSSQFRKTISVVSGASKGVRPYNRLPWGTLELEVRSTAKFHTLLGWIEGVKEEA